MHTRIAEMGLSTETIHIGAQHRNNTTICTHTHKTQSLTGRQLDNPLGALLDYVERF
jgi:hypothetical protein